jgi:hypothetical protein
MTDSLYAEEIFGILTDDDLYLDCVMVKSLNLTDEETRAIRVWVPRFPYTKMTTITCARQEVASYGREGKIAHLVFDLRGTGESEGLPGDRNFDLDLHAIRAWAEERFGKIPVTFLGAALDQATVRLLPIREGVVMESYNYAPDGDADGRSPILYLSSYGNFDRIDNARCVTLARAGHPVRAIDPLRYLLHASARQRLTPTDLWRDFRALCQSLPAAPIVVGLPMSSGLGLFCASGVEEIKGVIAIGQAQIGFNATHIFDKSGRYNFFLSRHVYEIAPRPVVLVNYARHPVGDAGDERDVLYELCGEPKRMADSREMSPAFLLEQINWIESQTRSKPLAESS